MNYVKLTTGYVTFLGGNRVTFVLTESNLAEKASLTSTTCVVLKVGLNPYNGFTREAVEKYWKTTPFECRVAYEVNTKLKK